MGRVGVGRDGEEFVKCAEEDLERAQRTVGSGVHRAQNGSEEKGEE